MTYVPSEVNNIILKYLPFITNNTPGILIRDIELEADRDMLGMDFDKKMWLALLDTLKNERDRRKSEYETVWEMPSVFYTAIAYSSQQLCV